MDKDGIMTKVIAIDLPSGRHICVDTLLDAIDLQVRYFLVEMLELGPSIVEQLTRDDFILNNGTEPVFNKDDAEELVMAVEDY